MEFARADAEHHVSAQYVSGEEHHARENERPLAEHSAAENVDGIGERTGGDDGPQHVIGPIADLDGRAVEEVADVGQFLPQHGRDPLPIAANHLGCEHLRRVGREEHGDVEHPVDGQAEREAYEEFLQVGGGQHQGGDTGGLGVEVAQDCATENQAAQHEHAEG